MVIVNFGWLADNGWLDCWLVVVGWLAMRGVGVIGWLVGWLVGNNWLVGRQCSVIDGSGR